MCVCQWRVPGILIIQEKVSAIPSLWGLTPLAQSSWASLERVQVKGRVSHIKAGPPLSWWGPNIIFPLCRLPLMLIPPPPVVLYDWDACISSVLATKWALVYLVDMQIRKSVLVGPSPSFITHFRVSFPLFVKSGRSEEMIKQWKSLPDQFTWAFFILTMYSVMNPW